MWTLLFAAAPSWEIRWKLSVLCASERAALLLIYTWAWSAGREEGCAGCSGWVQLPPSLAAMQCSYCQRFTFFGPHTSHDHSWHFSFISLHLRSTCYRFVLQRKQLKKTTQKPSLCFEFFFGHSLFICFILHILSSFIHSTVMVVLALQTRRVRRCSSPVRRSCI